MLQLFVRWVLLLLVVRRPGSRELSTINGALNKVLNVKTTVKQFSLHLGAVIELKIKSSHQVKRITNKQMKTLKRKKNSTSFEEKKTVSNFVD